MMKAPTVYCSCMLRNRCGRFFILPWSNGHGLSELRKIGNVIWEQDMVFEGKCNERERESNGESNVWCKTDGEKENREPYRDVRIQRFRWQRRRVRWYWHVLRSDDGHVLRKALEFEVRGKRKQGRPMKTWKTQVENKSRSIGLKKKGTMDGARWREGVREIAPGQIRPPPFTVLNLP